MSIDEAKEIRLNCSTIFLLPGVGLIRQNILKFGFLSAYLHDDNHEIKYENALYLLFKPEDLGLFNEFLKREKKRTRVLEEYDYIGGYVMIVYEFPKIYELEYKLFFEGKYSKFRNEYKKLFPEKVEAVNDKGEKERDWSITYHVFEQTEAIKKYWVEMLDVPLSELKEFWRIPDIENETLKLIP